MKSRVVLFVIFITLILGIPQVFAVPVLSGELTTSSGLYATGPWNSNTTKFSWNVSDTGDVNDDNYIIWRYDYQFTVPSKDISHLILEVSADAPLSDFKLLSEGFEDLEIGEWSPNDPSNPGIPGSVYGIKFETTEDSLIYSISVTTWRSPVWGDFYAKDGTDGGNWVYAYNTGFGIDYEKLANGQLKIVVPDTFGTEPGPLPDPIPEPTSIVLMGLGLIGIGIAARMRRK
jgi:hypothetical protein